MDPWAISDGPALTLGKSSTDDLQNKNTLEFEDHFQPFERLPDSAEYLSSLENKLKAVQRGSATGTSLSSREIIQSLEENHDSCMVRLLTDSVSNFDSSEPDELKVNPLLKKLAPEKQAVSVEELVHLVKADQLAVLLDGSEMETESLSEDLEESPKKPPDAV